VDEPSFAPFTFQIVNTDIDQQFEGQIHFCDDK